MALTIVERDFSGAFVAGPITSNSVALSAGSVMLVACVGFSDVTAAPTATGLTFTLINGLQTGSRGSYIWRALIPLGGFSGTVAMFGSSDFTIFYDIVEVIGAVTTGTNAADAIVQSHTVLATAVTPFDELYPSTFAQPTNGGYATFLIDQGADFSPLAPRSGWTATATGAAEIGIQRNSSDTAAGFTSTGPFGNIFGVMLELNDAGIVPTPTPVADDTWPDMLGRPQSQSPTVTVFA